MIHKDINLPDAYIIGVQKAGTTSLHNWLSQHPEIYSDSSLKDVDFFTDPRKTESPSYYFDRFKTETKNRKVFLQTHVNYIFYENSLRKLADCSDASTKFLLVLRNPTDRAKSAYKYFRKVKREFRTPKDALVYKPSKNFEITTDNNDFTYIEHGFFYDQLEVFKKYFTLDQLLILDFKDLILNPIELLKVVFSFLEVDVNYVPKLKNLNVTGEVKNESIQSFLYSENIFKTRLIKILNPLVSFEKRKRIRDWIAEHNTSRKRMPIQIGSEIDDYLNEVYLNDILMLKKHYNLTFLDSWINK